jgi:hypothetical protein
MQNVKLKMQNAERGDAQGLQRKFETAAHPPRGPATPLPSISKPTSE